MSLERGVWNLPVKESPFGGWFDTKLTGVVMVLARGNSGWQTFQDERFVSLPGQIYNKDIIRIFSEPGMTIYEIVVVSLYTGAWITLWALNKGEISYREITYPGKGAGE